MRRIALIQAPLTTVESRSVLQRAARVAQVIRAAGDDLVRIESEGSWGGVVPVHADPVVRLDQARFDGRATLEGILRDTAADTVVGCGLLAALGLGQVETSIPVWLDLCADPSKADPEAIGLFVEEGEAALWHRFLWALERADRVTADSDDLARSIRSMLAVRGRRRAEIEELCPRWIGDQELPGALTAWLSRPLRVGPPSAILGREEISFRSRIPIVPAESPTPGARREIDGQRNGVETLVRGFAEQAASLVLAAFDRRPRELIASSGGRAGGPARRAVLARLGRKPRLLIVMPYTVYPPHHGGAVRLWNLLRRISRDVDVFMMRFHLHGHSELEREALARHCRRVEFHLWNPTVERPVWGLEAPAARLFASEGAAAHLRAFAESSEVDVVQFEYSEIGGLRRAVAELPSILVEYDIPFRALERRIDSGLDPGSETARHYGSTRGDVRRQRRHDIAVAEECDEIHVVSEEDGRFLARHLADGWSRIRVVPNGVDVAEYSVEEVGPRSGVLFVGNYVNAQNLDAVLWFVENVWPTVRRAFSTVELTVAGAGAPEALVALDGIEGVRVVGERRDLVPLYKSHAVLVVPIRSGSGTRLKILEAFAAGIPVLSTTVGAEGLAVEPGRHFLRADGEIEFGDALRRLLGDEALRRGLANRALELVRARHDWKAIAEVELDAIYSLVEGARGGLPGVSRE